MASLAYPDWGIVREWRDGASLGRIARRAKVQPSGGLALGSHDIAFIKLCASPIDWTGGAVYLPPYERGLAFPIPAAA